jgi:outer membrane protein assembly factor BamB
VLIDKREGTFESTPIVWNNKIYIASRDGYLYCFGLKN